MVEYKVKNKVSFSDIGATKYTGFIEEYLQRLFSHRVFSDFAKDTVYMEAENAFRFQEDDKTAIGYWRGEFWGKLVISACRVCRYTSSEELKSFLKNAALTVISLAREDGYINSYADSNRVFPPSPEQAIQEVGFPCDWNWNIWCRKYTLWGLVECADLTGDKKILDGALRLALQLINQLKEMNIKLGETGTRNFCGLPSGSIIKPMALLYRMTGDTSLLDFCIQAAEDWDREDGKRPNLVRNGLLNTPIHTWYPNSELWAKAYELMSCLDGLLELYRITGTKKYFDAVANIYEQLKNHESNVMFSVGFNDIFANASKYQNALSEPCDIIHWMRICSELFALTGEIKYMNTVETAFYNAYIASISDDGTWSARCVRSSGRHFAAEAQCTFKYNHCCLNNLPRGFINVTQTSVMTSSNLLYINQYCPFVSEVTVGGGKVRITAEDGYLKYGKVKIIINTEKPINVMLRIPDFAGKNASITGIESVIPNTYCFLSVDSGESIIDADFDFSAQVHDFPYEMPDLPDDDFRILRWRKEYSDKFMLSRDSMMKNRCSYITYGPVLLAQSKKTGSDEKEMFDFESICGKGYRAKAEYLNTDNPTVMSAYKVTLDNGSDAFSRIMCAYGTASDNFSNLDEKFFNIYI